MARLTVKNFIEILLGAILLTGITGCADRSGVQIAPTAAQPCPPWVEFPANSHSNEDSAYLGCANDVNLRNMVENPTDLVRGRPLGPASGERESLGVDTYNKGKIQAPKSGGGATPLIVMPAAVGEGTQ